MSITTDQDMYQSIHDLPFVCRLDLPEAALQIYREAFDRARRRAHGETSPCRVGQQKAWGAVRRRFERDESGPWRTRGAW